MSRPLLVMVVAMVLWVSTIDGVELIFVLRAWRGASDFGGGEDFMCNF